MKHGSRNNHRNVGALSIRVGSWAPLEYNYKYGINKEPYRIILVII